ncbi:unnamed protein product [Vicia faba]|uniref:Uncharacterized protein n=1 Tax=Vicia faba TaxID=3906 RepID=A0AAV1B2V6_VICFA|nr:unnamed protein product [Vicia faba]
MPPDGIFLSNYQDEIETTSAWWRQDQMVVDMRQRVQWWQKAMTSSGIIKKKWRPQDLKKRHVALFDSVKFTVESFSIQLLSSEYELKKYLDEYSLSESDFTMK